jgi:hypothetical protein
MTHRSWLCLAVLLGVLAVASVATPEAAGDSQGRALPIGKVAVPRPQKQKPAGRQLPPGVVALVAPNMIGD